MSAWAYAIIQCVPNRWREEAFNVGIVMVSNHDAMLLRIKAAAFDGRSSVMPARAEKALNGFLERLKDADPIGRNYLDMFNGKETGMFQLSTARAIDVYVPEVTLERLFTGLVL